jgi:hypothetical protein
MNIKNEVAVISPMMLATTFKNMAHHVGMCPLARGNNIHHLSKSSNRPIHIYQGISLAKFCLHRFIIA